MSHDDEIEPRLGKPRSTPIRRGRSYMSQVLKAASLAGGIKAAGGRRAAFHGNRSGVGVGVGRVLASRDRFAAFRQRRVMVKSRIVRLDRARGMDAARAHLRYIQRDGVTREGAPGQLYSAEQDKADGRSFLDRQAGDRHQFRFIVSPEDGQNYDDLRALTRRLMAQMEQDLGTSLDWVAVDHFNTGHPHTHVIMRGKDERGHDLVIAREYLTVGMRERAAELVSLDLGPRSDLEIADRLQKEVGQERLTGIDRQLLRGMDPDRVVEASDRDPFQPSDRDPFQQGLRAGRLQALGRLGLAEEIAPGSWRLADGMDETLRRMGERGDIIRTMQRAFTEHGLERAAVDYAIADPISMTPIVGRVVERGLSDEMNDRHYLIVDASDGRSHYVDIGKGNATEAIPTGAVVRIETKSTPARMVDRTVAEIAAAHGGRYSVDIHLRHDPNASQTFAETHVRRLEAMRNAMGNLEREGDGTWIIAADHIERAAAFEAQRARAAPVVVNTLSSLPLDRQVGSDGATWLDRQLVGAETCPLRDAGFGRDVREALDRRRQWLIAEGLAQEEQGRLIFRANLLEMLRRRELNHVAGQLSDELGLRYTEARSGERIEGVYRRPIELASGRFALIEKTREFTLVPWRPVLDRHVEKQVAGIIRGDSINWTIGRQRAGPSVS
ncbi:MULTISPECIES: relaxase/mobilization nuclease RlxS [unclassified Sphingobium]|uniref:relaxase/mobilization nuclease RlxS n=1 Tax=unclassified Sphingobium TaxID=2611147 RepID=UPI000D1711AA|nr:MULTISPECIES: relaxase/mobilization nuclease RlxS [unclassified Sphingobium]MBG6116577.1 type IV secretory pathway VirD2 relaxase [Sphingobium sp. JAI105]PSO10871.1 conjugal transfer protein TraI [Sphingobium sp. AEW4]TWD04457.1 type IV secretory pathway VirD2 relaxase [Sphingobium sp. AEW010]TWD21874.1 type IV secretory pathway VirD2 relaxase [Sphingobium sp. AEW013]TWD24610.1 type IV secretory pathway VirD2 relaxase [Sphingobium sp. AEW001]